MKFECDDSVISSTNRDMYLRRVQKPTLSPFDDDKQCFKIKSLQKLHWPTF